MAIFFNFFVLLGILNTVFAILWGRKMFEAIFHILKDVDSLDLMIESYRLLIELDKVLDLFICNMRNAWFLDSGPNIF